VCGPSTGLSARNRGPHFCSLTVETTRCTHESHGPDDVGRVMGTELGRRHPGDVARTSGPNCGWQRLGTVERNVAWVLSPWQGTAPARRRLGHPRRQQCVGPDSNRRTPTGQRPQRCAVGLAWLPTHGALDDSLRPDKITFVCPAVQFAALGAAWRFSLRRSHRPAGRRCPVHRLSESPPPGRRRGVGSVR
jgi:hypothetical protein